MILSILVDEHERLLVDDYRPQGVPLPVGLGVGSGRLPRQHLPLGLDHLLPHLPHLPSCTAGREQPPPPSPQAV